MRARSAHVVCCKQVTVQLARLITHTGRRQARVLTYVCVCWVGKEVVMRELRTEMGATMRAFMCVRVWARVNNGHTKQLAVYEAML